MFCTLIVVPLHQKRTIINIRLSLISLPKRGRHKRRKNMDKNKMIVMLQYRIKRYQAMGNGAMCQNLMRELNKIQGQSFAAKAN